MVQVVSGELRSTRGYRNPPREVIRAHGPSGGREEAGQGVVRPPSPNRIGLGLGGQHPFPSLIPLLPSSPTWTRKGGNLLLLGVGIPPLGVPLVAIPPPPPLLYIRGGGAPHRHIS